MKPLRERRLMADHAVVVVMSLYRHHACLGVGPFELPLRPDRPRPLDVAQCRPLSDLVLDHRLARDELCSLEVGVVRRRHPVVLSHRNELRRRPLWRHCGALAHPTTRLGRWDRNQRRAPRRLYTSCV